MKKLADQLERLKDAKLAMLNNGHTETFCLLFHDSFPIEVGIEVGQDCPAKMPIQYPMAPTKGSCHNDRFGWSAANGDVDAVRL